MTCRACGSSSLSTILGMDPMPLAGAFARTREEALAAERYPLEWRWCAGCGLVNVAPSIPEAVIFADYSYRASDVPALVRHHEAFAAWLLARFPATRTHLEIGGNDGVLLRHLPWERVNCDPSDVAIDADAAWGLINVPFEDAPTGQYDLITSSNAFAHFDRLGDALERVRESLAPGGHFVVEVHDLDATLATGQWDTIYHEHRVEWSADALQRAGWLHGLMLTEWQRLPLHGGLLRAVFAKGYRRHAERPTAPDTAVLVEKYRQRRPLGATVAYGAAARATVYLNQVPERVEFIVDGSPRRAGRFVPGTGTPVINPPQFDRVATPDDRVLITAWNHAEDIKRQHPGFLGSWVTAW